MCCAVCAAAMNLFIHVHELCSCPYMEWPSANSSSHFEKLCVAMLYFPSSFVSAPLTLSSMTFDFFHSQFQIHSILVIHE